MSDAKVQPDTDATSDPKWLNVIGIGDDGWHGLGREAQSLINNADVLIGGQRHLETIPTKTAERRVWAGSFTEAVTGLAQDRGRIVVVLASGDPLLYGVGVLIAKTFSRAEVRVIPHVSTFAHVCARMVWPQLEVEQVSLCGRPVERLRGALGLGKKIVALSADGTTPSLLAAYLTDLGYGASVVHVFEHLGGAKEAHHEAIAADMPDHMQFADLNTVAIECPDRVTAQVLPANAGLPDDCFEHDGQMTKQEARSITIARLAPQPGELLWDIGLGSGSVSIEWLRTGHGMRAIGIERKNERAVRARRNADTLGVAGLTIVEGNAIDVLPDLQRPNAIFIGGGLTSDGIVELCWDALLPGGRLVANTVTLESEAVLLAAFAAREGSLTRVSVERADPVGHMTGWRPAMTVTQWAVTKPHEEPAS